MYIYISAKIVDISSHHRPFLLHLHCGFKEVLVEMVFDNILLVESANLHFTMIVLEFQEMKQENSDDLFFLEHHQTEECHATAQKAHKDELYQARIPVTKIIVPCL